MPLQIIAGSGSFDGAIGACRFQAKDASNGRLVPVSVTPDAMHKLSGSPDVEFVLEKYHVVLEQTASKKYDDKDRPSELELVDTDFVGG